MSELYAEIERLTCELATVREGAVESQQLALKLMADKDRLTRENAELLKATGAIEAGLRHETERLTRDLYEEVVENERLRAALINAIAPYATWGERVPPWVADARAALGVLG